MKYFALLLPMLPFLMTAAKSSDSKEFLTIELNDGPVLIELFSKQAPKHVERIKKLASSGEYDGSLFIE